MADWWTQHCLICISAVSKLTLALVWCLTYRYNRIVILNFFIWPSIRQWITTFSISSTELLSQLSHSIALPLNKIIILIIVIIIIMNNILNLCQSDLKLLVLDLFYLFFLQSVAHFSQLTWNISSCGGMEKQSGMMERPTGKRPSLECTPRLHAAPSAGHISSAVNEWWGFFHRSPSAADS